MQIASLNGKHELISLSYYFIKLPFELTEISFMQMPLIVSFTIIAVDNNPLGEIARRECGI
jgi:hypothetical protein